MSTITIMANSINDLAREIENFKLDYAVKSITYRFNNIEYYKTLDMYCQAEIQYLNVSPEIEALDI